MRDILGVADGVVHLTDAPSIPPLRASEIDGITFRALLDEYTIVQEHRVHTLQEMAFVSIRVNLCDPWDIMTSATREDKEYCSHTQCQE